MRLSAILIRSFCSLNSFTFGDWFVRANEPQTLYFQLVDLDQTPWQTYAPSIWPNVIQQSTIQNSLRYLTGQGVGTTPVIVTVTFPTMDCNASALNIVATPVDAADSSLFKVDLTALQVPGSGNVIFTVQEGLVIRKFFVQDGISVEDPMNLGQC